MSEQESKIYEDIYYWFRFLVLLVAVVGPFHRTILVFLSAQLLALKTTEESPVMDGKFVERSELQKSFLEAVSSIDSETVLVYGERGGGKTSLIHHALKNRKGVIAVQIKKTAHNEAQDEMIENISRKIQIFKSSQPSQLFIEDVFSWCPVEPVVVISLEARCGGDVLDGVITASKILSYENRHKGHARIVVDISGSRAAIEAGMIPLAVIGLLTSVVGAFYYIRIVKVIYMDEPAEPFVANDSGAHRAILIASTAFTLLYIAMPLPLVNLAKAAAKSLF